jgi:hypothetical protein
LTLPTLKIPKKNDLINYCAKSFCVNYFND